MWDRGIHHDSLLQARILPCLEHLHVMLYDLDTEGLKEIFGRGVFKSLQSLEISYPGLEQEEMEWQQKRTTDGSGYLYWG